ncbi:hypothetical protein [Tessaracoccus sp. ZS01]|uniref:hypothetical protein n=1 Tax=Tessaracoccus sp. ZS01 TaxID=1906324 RepID=UPI00096C9425|nr:hypothetical protein [Tessaracoccus sp. ZS01]MCG6566624.1 hypothetical protein [Tessaracoccus sp. ZS01]OMG59046.1 hypothetical protein BJN44_03140 [Tessaracoccus sp. ZS01]
MVGKLIKHEIRRTLRWYLIIVGGAVLVVGLATLAAVLLPAPVNTLFAVLTAIGAFAVPTAVPVWLGFDFYRSSYSKTGYLTRAIPVKGSTIYWVKLLYAYVLSVIALVVSAGLGYLAAVSFALVGGGSVGGVNDAIAGALDAMGRMLPGWVIVLLIALILVWPFVWLASYYFAAAVGSEAWSSKMGIGGPVLVWFLFYVAGQVAAILGAFLPLQMVFDEAGMVGFQARLVNIFTIEEQSVVPVGMFLAMLVLSAVAIVWASVSFDKKVELR